MNITQQKIAILGCGRSGIAAALLTQQLGAAQICIFDISPKARCAESHLPCVAAATEQHGRDYAADLIIISPGIQADTAWARSFCEAPGAILMGETELAYRFFKGQIIAITGTNGKTTTTALIEHILQNNGLKATACGNYGTPLSEVIIAEMKGEPCDYAVLEVSSFQMETIIDFRPELAIWLNFAPDHMDRYCKVSDYHDAKLRIFENMSSEQIAIVRQGENLGKIAPQRIEFSAVSDEGQLSYHDENLIEQGQPIIALSKTRMNQAHNAENCMAALITCRSLGLSDQQVQESIDSFVPPCHRCEMVASLDRILWLNDSKSTNLHSTFAALRSQTRPAILILGGKDKGLHYESLIPLLREKARHCICFGEIREQLEQSLSEGCSCHGVDTVEQSVELAAQLVEAGDVVLFSPATSSFDQFTSYVQRGQCFRDTVLKIIKP